MQLRNTYACEDYHTAALTLIAALKLITTNWDVSWKVNIIIEREYELVIVI